MYRCCSGGRRTWKLARRDAVRTILHRVPCGGADIPSVRVTAARFSQCDKEKSAEAPLQKRGSSAVLFTCLELLLACFFLRKEQPTFFCARSNGCISSPVPCGSPGKLTFFLVSSSANSASNSLTFGNFAARLRQRRFSPPCAE